MGWRECTLLASMRISPRMTRADPQRTLGRSGRLLLALRLPEDLFDLGDGVEELLAVGRVDRVLRLAGQLGGVPEQLVQRGVLLEMLGLEVVGPEHPQVMFAEL